MEVVVWGRGLSMEYVLQICQAPSKLTRKSHFFRLQGLPYHISALYVVDLARFRGIAAGDRLRIIYEQLSKDPGSLANLDQV